MVYYKTMNNKQAPNTEVEKMARLGNRHVKQLKEHKNNLIGVKVELTRKTTIKGNVIYAVVVTNMNTGYHYRIYTFDKIMDAFNTYKKAIA